MTITAFEDAVRYFLVQHVADVFRRESRNVGVIVERQGEMACKFYGEKADGELDGRAIRSFQYPEVYAQWVRYWKRSVTKEPSQAIKALTEPNGGNFNVFDAGFVANANGDPIRDVCNYAYSLLVSEGGLVEALGLAKDEDEALENLRADVASQFNELGILHTRKTLQVPYPVQEDVVVRGDERQHPISFYQQTRQHVVLIEPVNFITRQKIAARDHGVFAANAFRDIKKRLGNEVKSFALARLTNEQRDDEHVAYAVGVVSQVAELVDWSSTSERKKFLNGRVEEAFG